MPPRKPVRFSVGGTMSLGTFEQVVEIAQTLEELGFDGFYSSDHLFGVGGGGSMRATFTPLLEAWTLMAGLAPVTKTLKLGCMVTGVTYRHPAMLAKICSTIDVMSNGRLVLGIGAAWSKGDHLAYGIPFPGLKTRQEMLGEALDVIHGLWTERSFSYEGKHYRVEDAPMEPKPVQKPRPPVLIAAVGETGLALTAKHAQYWASLSTPSYAAEKIARIEALCAERGRDPNEIEYMRYCDMLLTDDADRARDVIEQRGRSLQTQPSTAQARNSVDGEPLEARVRAGALIGSPAEMREEVARYVDVGVTHIVIMTPRPWDRRIAERFSNEVISAFA